ncbi:hypothetical protein KUA11_17200 [Acetobacter estunensis]|jgi:2-(3-amino-3-carboxypropyl)histidine synthase|nr:hypothetical protein [Acetobacter estunensis]MBV1838907.1 hypothetical protein [Acetobacter estunensis]
MEDDRAQVDVGLAADIEESQMAQLETPQHTPTNGESQNQEHPTVKQPKKRFVGRRAAAEAASRNGGDGDGVNGESGALQGMSPSPPKMSLLFFEK